MRLHCIKCKVTSCPLCSKFYLNEEIKPTPPEGPTFRGKDEFIKELLNYITYLLAENQRLEKCLEDQLRATTQTLERKDKGKGILIESEEEDTPEQVVVFIEEAILKEAQQAPEGYKPSKRVLNRLYNMEVTFDISGVEKFTIRAILDTSATVCCIDLNSIPVATTEPSPYTIEFNGVNSKQTTKTKLKGGMMSIGENRFRIPFTYCFPMKISGDEIQMLIGCNFIRAMYGGLRIEGNNITFYKVVTTIEAKTDIELKAATAIPELDMDEIEFLEIQEAVFYTTGIRNISFEGKFSKLIQRLQDQGFIGENPIKHWARNKVICKLDIKNLDITIEDRPLKHVMPAMKEQFERHVSALLKLGVIRPSKSRHMTMAIMDNSGTTIDPKTRKEVKGKERMVFNYRTLNDNTHKDQYSLLGINTILKRSATVRFTRNSTLRVVFIRMRRICKWKCMKKDPRSSLKVCVFASGKFPTVKSTIDAENFACMETLLALKIHYLDKSEITLRTDCQAIISFYNKSAQNKPSRVRWLNFVDFVTGTGVQINFEHIDGKDNLLADSLSRLTSYVCFAYLNPEDEENLVLISEALDEAKEHKQWSHLPRIALFIQRSFPGCMTTSSPEQNDPSYSQN
ncbi:hypothetical protein OPV22_028736 [Ensete ventricosum]|uniref:Retropepsins domain-containing protein n=1 Tax=Ensete ventricosum TaxID=4639 RepID=A0AAV8Q3X2_ENSVE|nr:hypothetical protein OPV22_028736 [Ensete ventricosum]